MENDFTRFHRLYDCGLLMSGVDISDSNKKNQVNMCETCMNTVIQTFHHFQTQITQLTLEKEKLHQELNQIKKEQRKQKREMKKHIKELEEKTAELKKP